MYNRQTREKIISGKILARRAIRVSEERKRERESTHVAGVAAVVITADGRSDTTDTRRLEMRMTI